MANQNNNTGLFETFKHIEKINDIVLPKNALYIGQLTPANLKILKDKYQYINKTSPDLYISNNDGISTHTDTITVTDEDLLHRLLLYLKSQLPESDQEHFLTSMDLMKLFLTFDNQDASDKIKASRNWHTEFDKTFAPFSWNMLIFINLENIDLTESSGTNICWRNTDADICFNFHKLAIKEGTLVLMRDKNFYHSRPAVKVISPDKPIKRYMIRGYLGKFEPYNSNNSYNVRSAYPPLPDALGGARRKYIKSIDKKRKGTKKSHQKLRKSNNSNKIKGKIVTKLKTQKNQILI
jgi:hypothetical protein